jgi:hypothetical protein
MRSKTGKFCQYWIHKIRHKRIYNTANTAKSWSIRSRGGEAEELQVQCSLSQTWSHSIRQLSVSPKRLYLQPALCTVALSTLVLLPKHYVWQHDSVWTMCWFHVINIEDYKCLISHHKTEFSWHRFSSFFLLLYTQKRNAKCLLSPWDRQRNKGKVASVHASPGL